MNIIRGESISESALLTATKELYFTNNAIPPSFVEDECRLSFQKGQEDGKKIGYACALHEINSLFELLQTLSKKLLEQNKRLLEQLKPEIVEFAISLCERIIRKELSHPEALVQLINSLLNVSATHLRNAKLNIILSPDDLVMLETQLIKIQYDQREIEGISFHSDPSVQRGDCRIETPSGLLNYNISRELANLQAKIFQA